jgi:hypothetical protein
MFLTQYRACAHQDFFPQRFAYQLDSLNCFGRVHGHFNRLHTSICQRLSDLYKPTVVVAA